MTATPNYFFLDGQKLVANDNGDGTKTLVVSGGGGGGGGIADLLYIDDTNTVFIYRDTGSGALSAFTVPAGTAYTVGANPRPWSPPTLSTASGTGTVTTGTFSAFACVGQGTAVFVVSGTWTGTIIVEATNDNTNWFTTSYVAVTSGNTSSTFTANTQGQINTVGFLSIRLRSNTVASGTANVVWTSAPAVATVMLDNPLPAGSNNIGSINNITGTVSLPTGAATEATVAAQNAKIPALGQALAAASTPVVLPAAQITTLTPLSSVGLNAGTNAIGSITNTSFAVTQGTAANLNATVVGTGTFAVQNTAALPAGTNAIGSIIGQRPFAAAVTITRPANTTAYAVNQVLSTATTGLTAFPTFALGIGNSQRASINNITLISSNGATATKGQFAIHLFNSASPSGGGFNDAAAFAPTAAALATTTNELVGVVPSLVPMGTAAYGYVLTNDTRQVETDGSGNVYLAIVLQNAYTPASGETIHVIVSGTY